MGEAGHAFAEADQRGLGLAVHRRELLDVGDGKAGDLGRPRRRELRQDLALDLVEAQRVLGDVVAVGELVAHQDVHDAERQGGIGADADRQVESAALALRVRRGSITTIGTPRCFLCASASAQKCTLVAARSAPHEITRSECTTDFGIGAADRADRHVPRRLAAGVAHRAGLQARGAERMEQAVHQAAVHQALMGGVGVAQQGERAAFRDDRLPPGGDLVERLVPGDRRELAGALGAAAPAAAWRCAPASSPVRRRG